MGSKARSALAHPATILIACWFLFFVYSYPGYLSPDSVEQLVQGREGSYGDWHPPFMAAMWGVLDRIVAGPLLMLVAQSGAFLFGLHAILRRRMSARGAAVVGGAILLFPPVLTPMAVIWKDSQMAGYLLTGTACFLSPRRPVRIAGCLFFFLATAVRINAVAATLPLVVGLFLYRDGLHPWGRFLIAMAAWLAITAAAFMTNTALTDAKEHAWHNGTALHDIVGTIVHARPYPDQELNQILAGTHITITTGVQEAMRRHYVPYRFWTLNHGERSLFTEFARPEQLGPIVRAWKQLVVRNPLAYLEHRWKLSSAVLGLNPSVRGLGSVWDGFRQGSVARWDRIGFQSTHPPWQGFWINTLKSIDKSILFQPFLYLALALLLFPLCLRNRLASAILASGLAYEASMFVGAPTPDFRYSHWMITATIVAFVIHLADRKGAGRRLPQ